ncbi:MAG TPA: CRTAC1 family protein [Thermoanaerobaculia bacterium]|nr:CRTAC1 family protein [Thermoanaerobaculia bacterium]
MVPTPRTSISARCGLVVLFLALCVPARGTLQFVEVGAARGIGAYSMAPLMGGGVAVEDYDEDGDLDFFVANREGVADQLYRNLGNGHFEEIAAQAGLAETGRSRSALWFDYDGDGDLDLAVAGDCYGTLISCVPGVNLLHLYRQEADHTFTDVSAAAGVVEDAAGFLINQHRGGLGAADLDGDGFLDLYVALWNGASRLYHNLGNGSFEEVGAASGVATPGLGHWQPLFADWNHDGRMDFFVSIDFGPNQLWINQGDGTFVDVAPAAGVDTAWNEMGVAVGDYDNDGDLDLYCTNVEERSPGEHNVLFRNDSTSSALHFTEVANQLGVGTTLWGWGATFFDADRDGDLELAVTNGFTAPAYVHDPSRLFENPGDGGPFLDVSAASGFNDTYWGSSLVAADLDRDGDLDLLQTTKQHPDPGPLRLLENQSPAGAHYLVVRPRQGGANRRAIGAVVRIQAGGRQQMRLITAGTSFLGQEPAEAFFGLGSASEVDRLTIEWPGGGTTTRFQVGVDQILTVTAEALFADGFETGDLSRWPVTIGQAGLPGDR